MVSAMIHVLIFSHSWKFRMLGCGSHEEKMQIIAKCTLFLREGLPFMDLPPVSKQLAVYGYKSIPGGMHSSIHLMCKLHEFPRRQHGSLPSKLPKCHGSRDVSRICLSLAFQ